MNALSGRSKGDLLIVLAALIWGIAFYFQKTAMAHIGPLLFIGLRGCVAAVTLLPFAVIEQRKRGTGLSPVLPIACLGGVLFFIAAAIQQTGIVSTTITNTGFLTAIYVVVTPFLYWIIKKRSPSRVTWFSVFLAFFGIWGLSGGSIAGFSSGDIWVACSSVFWALLIITTGESAKWNQPMTYTCIQFLVVGIVGFMFAFALEPIDISAIGKASVSILFVGVLSSAFTFAIMAIALTLVSTPRASVLLSLETLFAAMAGYVLLGERLTVMGWFGAALILSAVLMLRVRKS